MRQFINIITEATCPTCNQEIPEPTDSSGLNTPLGELMSGNIPAHRRALKCFAIHGMEYVGDIFVYCDLMSGSPRHGISSLLRMPTFGQTALSSVALRLSEANLSETVDVTNWKRPTPYDPASWMSEMIERRKDKR